MMLMLVLVDDNADALLQHGMHEIQQSRVLPAQRVVLALLLEASSDQKLRGACTTAHKSEKGEGRREKREGSEEHLH